MLDKLIAIVPEENIFINELMKKHTTFKIGGPAEYFVVVNSLDELGNIIILAKRNNLPLHIIGNGSNLLISADGVRGIVVKLGMSNAKIISDNDNVIVEVEAGDTNASLARFLEENSISGFEFAAGIPGTIGGSVRMNAGAFGGEYSNIIEEVTVLDVDTFKIRSLTKADLKFSYRYSMFIDNKNYIIISAKFKFKKDDRENIRNRMLEIQNKRKAVQPIDKPSAGSTFRREGDFIPAKAIDDGGLKGRKVGGAEVSTKHAGFIINAKDATAKDVLELIEIVQEEIKKQTGVLIKPEMEIWN